MPQALYFSKFLTKLDLLRLANKCESARRRRFCHLEIYRWQDADQPSNDVHAFFELVGQKLARGTYELAVDDVTLEGYIFDRVGCILSAAVSINK